jgi:hypothetical protein
MDRNIYWFAFTYRTNRKIQLYIYLLEWNRKNIKFESPENQQFRIYYAYFVRVYDEK